MKIWRVEVDGNVHDYADCFFTVTARTYREAWNKALKIENRKIIKIYLVKEV